jgi:hypothetical protein
MFEATQPTLIACFGIPYDRFRQSWPHISTGQRSRLQIKTVGSPETSFCWSTLRVRNLDESLRFYREIIDLEVVNRGGPGVAIRIGAHWQLPPLTMAIRLNTIF